MQPIVNGLRDSYNTQLHVVELNAETDGQAIYQSLALRGHPATVIFLPDGTETFRGLGVQDDELLIDVIESAITIDGNR